MKYTINEDNHTHTYSFSIHLINERLNNLSLLNVKSDLLQELDLSTIIDAFSSAKCQKRRSF